MNFKKKAGVILSLSILLGSMSANSYGLTPVEVAKGDSDYLDSIVMFESMEDKEYKIKTITSLDDVNKTGDYKLDAQLEHRVTKETKKAKLDVKVVDRSKMGTVLENRTFSVDMSSKETLNSDLVSNRVRELARYKVFIPEDANKNIKPGVPVVLNIKTKAFDSNGMYNNIHLVANVDCKGNLSSSTVINSDPAYNQVTPNNQLNTTSNETVSEPVSNGMVLQNNVSQNQNRGQYNPNYRQNYQNVNNNQNRGYNNAVNQQAVAVQQNQQPNPQQPQQPQQAKPLVNVKGIAIYDNTMFGNMPFNEIVRMDYDKQSAYVATITQADNARGSLLKEAIDKYNQDSLVNSKDGATNSSTTQMNTSNNANTGYNNSTVNSSAKDNNDASNNAFLQAKPRTGSAIRLVVGLMSTSAATLGCGLLYFFRFNKR